MKDINKGKNLAKNMGTELNEAQMDNVSGGFGGIDTEVEVKTGDINMEMGNIGLINASSIKADINLNTSGDHNTVQNTGGINIGK